MGAIYKYPGDIMVIRETNDNEYLEQSWDKNTLDFIKSDDDKGAKTNKLTVKKTNLSKPGKLKLTNFGFKIPENAQIDTIKVGWVDKVEGSDSNSENPPIIPGVSMKLLNYPYSITKFSKAKIGVNYTKGESSDKSLWNIEGNNVYPAPTPDEINSSDFGIMLSYDRNISSNEGFVLMNYLRVFISWRDPKYKLTITPEAKTSFLNDEIVYVVTIRNTNNTHQGKPVKVKIEYNSSLSFIKYTDKGGGVFDDKNKIWDANFDEDKTATLFLKFRAGVEGFMECKAETEFRGIKNSANVNVISPKFHLQTSFIDSKIKMVQYDSLNYTIIASTNNDFFKTKNIDLSLPKEIRINSVMGDGKYNVSTGVWEAEFKNRKAHIHLNITPISQGKMTQKVMINEEIVLEKIFEVKKEKTEDENYLIDRIYPSGLQYLKNDESHLFNNISDSGTVLGDNHSLNKKIVIKAENINMKFDLRSEKIDNFKEYFIKFIKRDIKKQEFLALNNVSFNLKKGDRLGLIGLNGAGKSTLLKIIAGVMKPTSGSIMVSGRIAPLLELGAGFDPNYTGRENIFLNGSILGYSREFLEDKYDEIVEFSELGRFLDVPIKNYSSGMRSKLGFSIATIVNPDILILDEVLSVGDAKFRKKSGNKIKSLFESGVTVLLVSHSIAQVRGLCNKAIWLEKGRIVKIGSAKEVCDAYEESIN